MSSPRAAAAVKRGARRARVGFGGVAPSGRRLDLGPQARERGVGGERAIALAGELGGALASVVVCVRRSPRAPAAELGFRRARELGTLGRRRAERLLSRDRRVRRRLGVGRRLRRLLERGLKLLDLRPRRRAPQTRPLAELGVRRLRGLRRLAPPCRRRARPLARHPARASRPRLGPRPPSASVLELAIAPPPAARRPTRASFGAPPTRSARRAPSSRRARAPASARAAVVTAALRSSSSAAARSSVLRIRHSREHHVGSRARARRAGLGGRHSLLRVEQRFGRARRGVALGRELGARVAKRRVDQRACARASVSTSTRASDAPSRRLAAIVSSSRAALAQRAPRAERDDDA